MYPQVQPEKEIQYDEDGNKIKPAMRYCVRVMLLSEVANSGPNLHLSNKLHFLVLKHLRGVQVWLHPWHSHAYLWIFCRIPDCCLVQLMQPITLFEGWRPLVLTASDGGCIGLDPCCCGWVPPGSPGSPYPPEVIALLVNRQVTGVAVMGKIHRTEALDGAALPTFHMPSHLHSSPKCLNLLRTTV